VFEMQGPIKWRATKVIKQHKQQTDQFTTGLGNLGFFCKKSF